MRAKIIHLNKLIDARARKELRALVYHQVLARKARAVDHATLQLAPGQSCPRAGSDERGRGTNLCRQAALQRSVQVRRTEPQERRSTYQPVAQ
jgi:hypothetical protein